MKRIPAIAFLSFVFLATFATSEVLIYPWAPPPPDIGTQFLEYKQKKDEVSVLFIGSSHSKKRIIPSIVEPMLKETGVPHRTYVLGMDGATGHEINSLIRRVLALDPTGLKLIVVEDRPWTPVIARRFIKTRQFSWWHDPVETRSVLRSLDLLDFSAKRKWKLTRWHLFAMVRNCLNLGVLTGIPDREQELATLREWAPRPPVENLKKRSNVKAAEKKYREGVGRVPGPKRFNELAHTTMIHSIESQGIEVAILLPPSYERFRTIHGLMEQGKLSRVLDFSDPEEFPELFEMEARFVDGFHLNRQGAEIFSRLLAEKNATQFPNL